MVEAHRAAWPTLPKEAQKATVAWLVAHARSLTDPEEVTLESEDPEAIREALLTAAGMLEDLIRWHRDDAADRAAHAEKCEVCGTWYDARKPREWGHSDGRGDRCLGDGTVVTQRCGASGDAQVWTPAARVHVPLDRLTAGDLVESAGERTFIYREVVEPARRYYDGHRSDFGLRVRRA